MAPVAVIAGARPNFMKVDPLLRAMERVGIACELIHTGQHYDRNMSDIFFEQLGIRTPDVSLGVGSGSHARQTANIMIAFEEYCDTHEPQWIVVAGDVNSTIACSLVAAKRGIRVAHLEAGLRSNDWSMPEEVNRVLTDRLSDILLTPSRDGDENLIKEGIDPKRIFFVGNIMIDTLLRLLPTIEKSAILQSLKIAAGSYILGTFHRPSNVDGFEALSNLVSIILSAAERAPIVLPVHPRTRKNLSECGLLEKLDQNGNVSLLEPLGYIDFVALTKNARVVMTDSGGIQEETTVLAVPCLTLRENTERPVTVSQGTNELVGLTHSGVIDALDEVLENGLGTHSIPELWDGKTGERCAAILKGHL